MQMHLAWRPESESLSALQTVKFGAAGSPSTQEGKQMQMQIQKERTTKCKVWVQVQMQTQTGRLPTQS